MGSDIIVTVTVTIYLLFMLWTGWYLSTKTPSDMNFMVAGWRLGPLLMAGMLVVTKTGSGSSLSVVQNGMSSCGLSVPRYVTTTGIALVILSFIAPEFRVAAVKMVPGYFRRRYGRSCGLITAIIMLLPPAGLTTGQFITSTVILSAILGTNYQTMVIIVAMVVTVYSITGGLRSVTLIDFIQVFLTVIGMIIAAPSALNYAGGQGNVMANIPTGTMNLFEGYDLFSTISLVTMYTTIFSVGQETVSHFYVAKGEKVTKGGARLVVLADFIYAFIPMILGIIVLALINMGKFSTDRSTEVGARYALPVLVTNTIPAIICGLLLTGIISATILSSGPDLPGTGSIFANDVYKAILEPDASNKSVMSVTKIVICLVGLASMFTALFDIQSIVSILVLYFTLQAAGSSLPYMTRYYWKKAFATGIIVSLIAGIIVVVYLERISGGILFGIKFGQPITPGLVVAFICFIIFSYLELPAVETTELAPEGED